MTPRPSVAVFDYGIGNLRSPQKALQFAGADATLTSDEELLREADGVVLPGVGAFGRCSEALTESGLFEVATSLAKEATQGGKPFLGICVGMQLLYKGSDESNGVQGLGIINERIRPIPEGVKIPQMQWNKLECDFSHPMFIGVEKDPWVYFVHSYAAPKTKESKILEGVDNDAWVYFVHSYRAKPDNNDIIVANADYGIKVPAVVEDKLFFGTQFHPEKSGKTGLLLLGNFLSLLRNAKRE